MKSTTLKVCAALAAIALMAPQPATGGSSYQLLCASPLGGAVNSTSSGYQLQAVIDWTSSTVMHQSTNYRLIHGCQAADFQQALFDALFQDRFSESPGN